MDLLLVEFKVYVKLFTNTFNTYISQTLIKIFIKYII